MINDQYSPEEQAIIQQIQSIPRLEISASARESIHTRMLNEFRVVNQQSGTNSVPQTRLVALTITAVVVITIIVVIILALISSQNTLPLIATATPDTRSATPGVTTTSTPIPTETMTIILSPSLATLISPNVSETFTAEPPTLPPATQIVSTPVIVTSQVAISTATPEITKTMESTSTVDLMLAITPSASEPALSPSVTATLDAIIVIEGPVIDIVNNIITIYDFDIEIEVNHPIFNLIEIGDLVRIEGAYGTDNVVVATVVSNLSSTPLVNGATVSLDGPVESINGNIILVNGIAVQLAANDPLLQTVQVGQFVSVQGNFQGSGTNIVLTVVKVVLNTNVTVTGNNCWYHDGMGMGHWHCDGQGMGMGDPDTGMGGMGMGEG